MEKTCKKCSRRLPIDSFPKILRKGKSYHEGQCAECKKLYFQEYNRTHQEKHAANNQRQYLQVRSARLAYARDYRLAHADEIKLFKLTLRQKKEVLIEQAKDKPCLDCGRKFPRVAMDFDHVRGEKKRGIAQMVNGAWSIETLLAEIAKCELVCANCHRVRTALRNHLKSAKFGEKPCFL
jgi:hypothetical protein